MRTYDMDQLRIAMKAMGAGNDGVVTIALLADVLGLETESQRQILRRRVSALATRGEVEKVAFGQYRYIPGSEPSRNGKNYQRIWRLIRIQQPGWTRVDIAALARCHRTVVDRYGAWLEGEGFVVKAGKRQGTALWRTTAKGLEQRETPWPPLDNSPEPYMAERAAAGALATILLTQDPAQASVQLKIRKHVGTLMKSFCTQDENKENGGNQHD